MVSMGQQLLRGSVDESLQKGVGQASQRGLTSAHTSRQVSFGEKTCWRLREVQRGFARIQRSQQDIKGTAHIY
jgi:hypothetical protein